MTENADRTGEKQRGRPFQKGQSGNPAGRPQGSRNKALVALDQIAEGAAPQLLQQVVQAAQGGDVQAARLVLERAWPARKGRPVRLELPSITDSESLVQAASRVIEATAAGELSPEEGAAITAILDSHRRVIETAELERRIADIETRIGKGATNGNA